MKLKLAIVFLLISSYVYALPNFNNLNNLNKKMLSNQSAEKLMEYKGNSNTSVKIKNYQSEIDSLNLKYEELNLKYENIIALLNKQPKPPLEKEEEEEKTFKCTSMPSVYNYNVKLEKPSLIALKDRGYYTLKFSYTQKGLVSAKGVKEYDTYNVIGTPKKVSTYKYIEHKYIDSFTYKKKGTKITSVSGKYILKNHYIKIENSDDYYGDTQFLKYSLEEWNTTTHPKINLTSSNDLSKLISTYNLSCSEI